MSLVIADSNEVKIKIPICISGKDNSPRSSTQRKWDGWAHKPGLTHHSLVQSWIHWSIVYVLFIANLLLNWCMVSLVTLFLFRCFYSLCLLHDYSFSMLHCYLQLPHCTAIQSFTYSNAIPIA